MDMVFGLLAERVRPNAPNTTTKIAIIRSNPLGDRGMMHASSAYSTPQIARRTHSRAVSGPTFDDCLKVGKIYEYARVLAEPL